MQETAQSFLGYMGPIFIRGIITATVVMALAWGTIEWLFSPLKITKSEIAKIYAAFILGLVALFCVHWLDVVSFGGGPRGWALAMLFGFLGGGMAPFFHKLVVSRFRNFLKTNGGKKR